MNAPRRGTSPGIRRLKGFVEPKRVLRSSSFARATFGVTGVLRPDLLGRTCGMDRDDITTEAQYVLRLFAARDLLLAVRHFNAPSTTDEAALRTLEDAAVTGLLELAIMLSEMRRREGVTGGLRAGVVFAITDGVGYSLARLAAG